MQILTHGCVFTHTNAWRHMHILPLSTSSCRCPMSLYTIYRTKLEETPSDLLCLLCKKTNCFIYYIASFPPFYQPIILTLCMELVVWHTVSYPSSVSHRPSLYYFSQSVIWCTCMRWIYHSVIDSRDNYHWCRWVHTPMLLIKVDNSSYYSKAIYITSTGCGNMFSQSQPSSPRSIIMCMKI